jgi:hypothetical protein
MDGHGSTGLVARASTLFLSSFSFPGRRFFAGIIACFADRGALSTWATLTFLLREKKDEAFACDSFAEF